MSAFARIIPHVLEAEGGLVNNPKDPGGITNYGISLRFAGSVHFDLNNDGRTNSADIIGLSEQDAVALYRKHFWDLLDLDQFPPAIAFVVFDAAVNQGPSAAIRDLQMALNVSADGKFGPKSFEALRKANKEKLLSEVLAFRALRYARTRNFATFGVGWMRRLMKIGVIAAREL